MAALLTILAVIAGAVLGFSKGGSLERLRHFGFQLWQVGTFGLLLQAIIALFSLRAGPTVALDLLSAVCFGAFAFANIRIGGMVLVAAGLILNTVPTLFDWGMPTSRPALERAGVVAKGSKGRVELEGPRHIATSDDSLTWLGEIISLPTKQVISFGDVVLEAGYLLAVASALRGRRLRRSDDDTYRQRITPLGQGPARRWGPGLHPSRLGAETKSGRRR